MPPRAQPKDTRATKRARSAELRRAAKEDAARRQEDRDETISPAIQRRAVLDASGAVLRNPNGAVIATLPDGTVLREALRGPDGALMREAGAGVLRAARVQRDGAGFNRTDVLSHMAAEINEAREAGTTSMFSTAHFAAAKRLRAAWDAAGDGVGLGASDWGRVGGGRATAPSEQAGHSALVAQVKQRVEIEAAAAWLGGLWPAVRDMALVGMSASAWGAKVGMDRKAVPGYLRAALDRLVEFYAAKAEPPRPTKIRTIGPARAAYDARVPEGVEG